MYVFEGRSQRARKTTTRSESPASPSQSGEGPGARSQEPSVQAAVDWDVRAADVRGPARAQECNQGAELARLAEATSGNPGHLVRRWAVLAVEVPHAGGRDAPRADGVDRDAPRSELVCKRL